MLRTVHMFSTNVGLTFGLDKCANITVVWGEFKFSGDVVLPDRMNFMELSVGETCKYLGLFEAEGLDCSGSKEVILKAYLRRLSLIWKSYLIGPGKVRATNSICVLLLSYDFSLFPWTKMEIAEFDVKTRKLLTASCNHNPRSAVEHLYLPRNAGAINVENLFCVTIACLLPAFTYSLICKCFKLDELLPLRSGSGCIFTLKQNLLF